MQKISNGYLKLHLKGEGMQLVDLVDDILKEPEFKENGFVHLVCRKSHVERSHNGIDRPNSVGQPISFLEKQNMY